MLTVAGFDKVELARQLGDEGIVFRTGPFAIQLKTRLVDVIEHVHQFYRDYPLGDPSSFADFHVRIDYPANLRRWIKPQVYFYLDERVPFKPLPAGQAAPMLEWGLNWCIANHAHQYLILHAAALEKNGQGLLMPAEPGAGKSTLAAGLMARGWRLLSDELGIIDLQSGELVPLARPVNLKNESIEVIRRFSPHAKISRPYHDTNKGTVGLVAAPQTSIERVADTVPVTWVLQPNYLSGAGVQFDKVSKAQMFMHMAHNSFNYSLLALKGFEALSALIDQAECYDFVYGHLDGAISWFDQLAG